jgi:AcrR family transcriptional regulator
MVAETPSSLRLVGDADSAKHRQIIDGARKVFLDLGFDGASMGEIARAAGVSKGTLYVYFADKNRLFEAIVEEESLEQGKVAFNFDPERDVTTTLAGPISRCCAGRAAARRSEP